MSDVEFITGANHQRAREREWNERRAERDGLREKRERVRRAALSVCWLAGAFLSGMALVLLAEPLLRRRLHRWQGAACLVLYFLYLAAVSFAPRAGA